MEEENVKSKKKAQYEQRILPYLLYRDVGKAMTWLNKAFGLKETGESFKGEDGAIQHAAMKLPNDVDVIMMGCPGPKYKNPKKLGSVTQMLYIYVDDADKHFARAKKAGAKVLEKPSDTFYGERRYGVTDPEGHQWFFAHVVQQMSMKEMKAAHKSAGANS
jgi:uncharacterized glyoxalase superfamily protein PhnB